MRKALLAIFVSLFCFMVYLKLQRQHSYDIQNANNSYDIVQQKLIDANAKMTGLKDHYRSDADFHIGRSQEQRERWLENDTRDIEKQQLLINNLQVQIDRIQQQRQ